MRKFLVCFDQEVKTTIINSYQVEVEAETMAKAVELARELVEDDPSYYWVDDEAIEDELPTDFELTEVNEVEDF